MRLAVKISWVNQTITKVSDLKILPISENISARTLFLNNSRRSFSDTSVHRSSANDLNRYIEEPTTTGIMKIGMAIFFQRRRRDILHNLECFLSDALASPQNILTSTLRYFSPWSTTTTSITKDYICILSGNPHFLRLCVRFSAPSPTNKTWRYSLITQLSTSFGNNLNSRLRWERFLSYISQKTRKESIKA